MNVHHFSIDYILGSSPYVVPFATIENQSNGMHLAVTSRAYVDLLRALLRISAYIKVVSSSGILRDIVRALNRPMFRFRFRVLCLM